ncbi:MAG: ornithine carbamoyltransferase [Polyangiaceae bacterium]|nr:ornithine carbamoyltransferase [Polyangiaceae bacterium]
MKRHFLRLGDCTKTELEVLLARAAQLKAERKAGKTHTTLAGKTLALVFEKASTRTRVSFEAAMGQLGGQVITLTAEGSQIARGEPPQDTARVLARYVDIIMLRTFGDDRLRTFASASTVPVINGLSDGAHPVQLLADLQTVQENFGTLHDRVIAFVGDGKSNMAQSWIEAAGIFGFQLHIAAPDGYAPHANASVGNITVTHDAREAVKNADVINTDVWTSMGQEAESKKRLEAFRGYSVDAALLAAAPKKAIVLHCLPAHRGEEISEEALEGAQSRVFDQAENRLHAQKALLELLLVGGTRAASL